MTPPAPRAFISHASEDQSRFVRPFATSLREAGVDAWFSEWEIGPGDSLVRRIFDEGIAAADAFVVVLSHASVTKPWVREELDAGVVSRITSGGTMRLIPIVLDAEVEVPAPLRHLRWESVPKDGFQAVVRSIVDSLHGRSQRPALGAGPRYTATTIRWTFDTADETVFRLVAEKIRAHDGPGWNLFSDDIQARALEEGLNENQFRESMHALTARGLVNAQEMGGGTRWMLRPFDDRVWLDLEEESGVDLASMEMSVLARIVNEDSRKLKPSDLGVGWFTLGAILRRLQERELIQVSAAMSGEYAITRVSPLAPRALRGL